MTLLAELVASPAMEQRQQHGCKLQSIIRAARQNPARVFAILAGIAFVCLLGTFVAQVVLAIVCGVRCLPGSPYFREPHTSTLHRQRHLTTLPHVLPKCLMGPVASL